MHPAGLYGPSQFYQFTLTCYSFLRCIGMFSSKLERKINLAVAVQSATKALCWKARESWLRVGAVRWQIAMLLSPWITNTKNPILVPQKGALIRSLYCLLQKACYTLVLCKSWRIRKNNTFCTSSDILRWGCRIVVCDIWQNYNPMCRLLYRSSYPSNNWKFKMADIFNGVKFWVRRNTFASL